MPAIQRSEFALALNQVSNERGLDPAIVLDTVKNAILAAYRKDHPGMELEEYTATLDANTGEAKIFNKNKDVTPPGFGRIAAQTAKQVILQKIREKEKEAIISDYKLRIGTIINGMVLRFAGPNIIVDIGKAEAVMPSNEQIPNEKYHLNQRLAVYLAEIKEGLKGEEVIVSRAHTGLLEGLFKREVPEVAQGAVEIKQIVREPGNRSKVAVYSNQSGIDPVGSCVGQKGVRVQAVIQEFGGLEKIDIIQWQENSKNYIVQALSPAKNIRLEVDEKEKVARVTVPSDELSLAIGKDGQNVRLASKLTGYRIEIEGESAPVVVLKEEAAEEKVEKPKKTTKAKEKVTKPKKAVKKAKKEVSEEKLAKETQEISKAVAKDVTFIPVAEIGEEEVEVAQSIETEKKEVLLEEEKPKDADKTSEPA
jgi:N utilization substance protein A